jgi:lipid-A-disaccharide synthase
MELDRLLDLMLQAARRVREDAPGVALVLAVASPIFRDRIEAAVAKARLPVTLADGASDVMRASTVLLMASGTATVEAMIMGVPMVVTYRMSWLNYVMAHLAVNSRWAAIPNIMGRADVVPELLQWRATPGALAGAVSALLRDPPVREAVRARLRALAARLGPPGAASRAASEVLAATAPALKPDLAIK